MNTNPNAQTKKVAAAKEKEEVCVLVVNYLLS